MSQNGLLINRLTYADDIVIFCSGRTKTIKMVMKQIRNYEKSSRQLASASRINRMKNSTGFMDKEFPFTYCGCPIYAGKKKNEYVDDMIR
ncbi:hypothetical protein H5410_014293 [Solanum commersonii]|uniref:Reverse transcriptase domain-containing protein n=1 Tax=Solanum commersonii TaxID=4109 RepID=A0A9J5ZQI2_SOLCO|nr:hypothetical protein H5410_014293 [Solanum commersonii]